MVLNVPQLRNHHTATVLNQIVCSGRQLMFGIFKSNNFKIDMNTTANKFYHINKQIGLDKLALGTL